MAGEWTTVELTSKPAPGYTASSGNASLEKQPEEVCYDPIFVERPDLDALPRFYRGRQSRDGLLLSLDRKVSPGGWYQESRNRMVASVPNSFGLPAGESCPGRTSFCVSCYGALSEQSLGVYESLSHNFEMLKDAGTAERMATLLARMVGTYAKEADRLGLSDKERIFRIHWDGDFFSVDYARAWAAVTRVFPEISFFAYTRSFRPPVNVVPALASIDNLSLYLSVDDENLGAALEVIEHYPNLSLAGCADDYSVARTLIPDGRRSTICPENSGRIPLMERDGTGACVQCQLCVRGMRDVLFSTSHREHRDPQMSLAIGHVAIEGQCAHPECDNPLPVRSGRGRPKKWCGLSCRTDVYNKRQTLAQPTSKAAPLSLSFD